MGTRKVSERRERSMFESEKDSREDEDGSSVVVRSSFDVGIGEEENGEDDGDAVVLRKDETGERTKSGTGQSTKSRFVLNGRKLT